MTNQPRRPLRSDVSPRAIWRTHPDDGDNPPINPKRRHTLAAAPGTTTAAVAPMAQDRPWRTLLNSTLTGGWL